MALALLEPDDVSDAGARAFRFEIGHNRYYRVAVGDKELRSRHGLALLAAPIWVSPLAGPLPVVALGRGRIAIPERVFTREARFVQMMSYRNSALEGPAISPVVEATAGIGDGLPPIAFSGEATGRVLVRPMDYREQPLVRAMFLENFFNILPSLLQPIGSLLGSIGPALTSGNAGKIAQAVSNPNTLNQIANLISQILNRQAAAGGAAPSGGAAPALANSLSDRWHRTHAQSLGHASYSTAQVLPLAALAPMLMPLLQQVVNPQTVQSLLDAPNKSAQTIINGIMDAARIGLEANKAHLDHLRQLNPGVDDAGLDQLIMNLAQSLSGRHRGISFKRSERVRLAFEGLTGLPLGGQTRVLFALGRPLRFPVRVELPTLKNGAAPVLKPAILQLQVKDHDTLDVVLEKRFDIPAVTASGPLPVTAHIEVGEVARLSRNKTYLVSLALVWKTRNGEKRGAVITTRMDLAGPATFDRVNVSGPVIDLSDPVRFRDYWHKVWGGRLDSDAKRYAVEVTYLIAPAPVGRAENARLETETRMQRRENSLHTIGGRIKSGMELSLVALNRLLTTIKVNAKPLDADELAALDQPEFREQLNLMARKPIELRGRTDESVAIWAYPAMRLASVVLVVPAEIDANGHVTKLEEKTVTLPMPALLHLIGTRAR